jgi:hypothetical protein
MQWKMELEITPHAGSGGSAFEQLIEGTRQYVDENYDELTQNGQTIAALYRARDAALFSLNRNEERAVTVLITGEDANEFGIQMAFERELSHAIGGGKTNQKTVDAGGGKR